MQKRQCPKCQKTVPVVDQSIGSIVTCPFCNAEFLAEPICPHCGRPTQNGTCDCGVDSVASRPSAWPNNGQSSRAQAALAMLAAGIVLAIVAVLWIAANSKADTPSSINLLERAPRSTIGYALFEAPALMATEATADWTRQMLGRLPIDAGKATGAAVFLFPATREEGDPYRLLAAGVVHYADITNEELATELAEVGEQTTIGGADAFAIDGYFAVPQADGIVLLALTSDALSALVDSQALPDSLGLSAPLRRLSRATEGDLARVAIVLPDELRRYGCDLPVRMETADITGFAAGLAGGQALTVNIHMNMKNVTTAGNMADRFRKALEAPSGLEGGSVQTRAETITLTGKTDRDAIQNTAARVIREITISAPVTPLAGNPESNTGDAGEETPVSAGEPDGE